MTYEDKIKNLVESKLSVEEISYKNLKDVSVRSHFRYLRNVVFEEGVSLESTAITSFGKVFVGAHSYMNEGGYLRTNISIGRFCSIGRRVTIAAGMHNMFSVSTAPILSGGGRSYTADESSQLGRHLSAHSNLSWTHIGHDVWIGDGAVIMPGVSVGTGSVIGANSVVTRNVEPYSIVAGAPARIVKSRFPDYVVKRLLETNYWGQSLEKIKSFSLGNVFDFINELDHCDREEFDYVSYALSDL